MTLSRDNRSLVWLSITIITFLLITSYLQSLDQYLITPLSPKGMYSFEIAGDDGYKILDLWKKARPELQVIQKAIIQTYVDFVFIIVYTLLLWQLLERSAPPDKDKEVLFNESNGVVSRKWWLKTGRALLFFAALMDCCENIFILIGLHSGSYDTAVVKAIAIIKIVAIAIPVLAIVIRSLRWLSAIISQLLKGIWLFRLVFLGLLVTFLVLWVMDQGQDLLLTVTSNRIGPIVTLITLSIFAACNWYLPKYYQLPDRRKLTFRNFFLASWDYAAAEHTEYTFTGRLLGAFSLMLPGACILHAMQIFQVDYWLDFINPMTILVILLIIYYLILKCQWLCNQRMVLIIASVVLAAITLFGILPGNSTSQFLGYFALDFFLLSFVFLLYTNVRKSTTKWSVFDIPITPFITIAALVVSLVFIYANLNPLQFAFDEKGRSLTLSVVFSSLIFYVFVLTIFLLLGKKFKIQILTFLIVLMFVLTAIVPSDYHRIRLYSYERHGEPRMHMESLGAYTAKWLKKREPELARFNSDQRYPIFIVNAPGGGIRAAAWTSKVMNSLDTVLQSRLASEGLSTDGPSKDFQHYVFAYSCASGGTMGAAVLCAQRYNRLSKSENETQIRGDFYKRDFLTPVFIQLFGRDLWLAFTGSRKITDRAAQQEKVWENQAAESMEGLSLRRPLSQYWYDPKVPLEVPLLFANSYWLEMGQKAIIAPVLLSANDFPVTFLMSNHLSESTRDSLTFRLSTAALLTARFPFISPAGKLDDFRHFLDGGFTENSGAETAEDVRRVLKKTVDSMGWTSRIEITMLSLPNTMSALDTTRTAKNLFEIGAPLTGAINTSVGNMYKAERLQVLRSKDEGYDVAKVRPIARNEKTQSLVPLLPLGWQISDSALSYMDYSIRLEQNQKVIQRLVKKVVGKKIEQYHK